MTQASAALVTLASLALSYLGVRRLLPEARPSLTLGLTLAGSLSLGAWLFSLGLYLAPDHATTIDLVAEASLLLLLGRRAWPPLQTANERPHPILAWVVGAAALVGLLVFWDLSQRLPHGSWDAWGSWNLRARFFALVPGDWQRIFHPALHFTHPDYPMLLPAGVARTWRLVGAIPPFVPRLHAFLFPSALILLTGAAVAIERGVHSACVAACFLCLGPVPLDAASQYADLPLACFMVAAVALVLHAGHHPRERAHALTLAGVAAGLASFTKNEGLVYLILFCAVITFRRRRDLPWVLLGASPGALLSLWHKRLAPPDDYRSAWTLTLALADLAEWHRHRLAARCFARAWWSFQPALLLPLALALWWRRPSPALKWVLPLLAAMTASYLVAMVTTPHELAWHLQTAGRRLMLQIYPLGVLTLFLALPRAPASAASPPSSAP
jgi:hypothetical protein